jgi:predicted enzyme related to lactoylglutathione lyase
MPVTTFAMTKLVVGDVERAKAFYGAVCGLKEARRVEGAFGSGRITELIMEGEAPAAATLVLFTYHGQPAPAAGECMLVFETPDIEAFVARAVEAGGSVMQPVQALPDFGLSFGFVRDPEGHIVEAIQRHAPSA